MTSCGRTHELRALIAGYEGAHGSIVKRLKKKLGGNLESLMLAFIENPAVLDAELLNLAMAGMGTNTKLLVAVLASLNRDEMLAAAAQYQEKYHRPLVDAIRTEESGDLRDLLVTLAGGSRAPEDLAVDVARAHADAQALLEAGEIAATVNRRVFSDVLARSSVSHLAAVAAEYTGLSRYPKTPKDTGFTALETAIDKKIGSNSYSQALLAVLHPATAIAEQFNAAVKGVGTNDFLLIRLVVRTQGMRMLLAKQAFFTAYKKSMLRAIEDDTGGNYRHALRRIAAQHQGALSAVMLREAFKGVGTDERKAIDVLLRYNASEMERFETAEAYAMDYNRPLPDAILGEMGNALGFFLSILCYTRVGWDAHQLRVAMKGMGTDPAPMVDVICSRGAEHLADVKAEYLRLYKKELAAAVAGDVSGHVGQVFQGLLNNTRTDTPLGESEIAVTVDRLYRAGEGTAGTKDTDFVDVFLRYSALQLGAIDRAYRAAHTHSLFHVIEKELSGTLQNALLASCNPVAYASRQIRESMKGFGTDDRLLVRSLAHRLPAEFVAIDTLFNDENHKSIKNWIEHDCGGSLKLALTLYIDSLVSAAAAEAALNPPAYG
eukprot:c18550_g3_i3.p2 GENE.c18550_g3_i3~~c18550_g3_i3.p2  ORF type:complete len:604 (+),score=143.80 c18550_g3_i3:377-2188(+)